MIHTGDIAIVRRHLTWHPASWLSAAVRFFTGCRYNHSFIFVRLGGVLCVVEAVSAGVVMIPFEKWKKKYPHTLKVIRHDSPAYDTWIISRALASVGAKYDYTSLLKHQVIRQIYRWFEIDIWTGRHKGTKASVKFYCSEHSGYCRHLPDWWKLTTADLLELPHEVIQHDIAIP